MHDGMGKILASVVPDNSSRFLLLLGMGLGRRDDF